MSPRWIVCAGLLLATTVGCPKPEPSLNPWGNEKDYGRPLPPGQLALRKIAPEDYPDFKPAFDNRLRLAEAVQNSLSYLAKPSSQNYFPYGEITHGQAVSSLQTFLQVLQTSQSAEQLDQAVRSTFEVYQSVGCDDRGTVFFTGYYCPIFDGRRQPDAQFRYPLYSLPPDLVKDGEGNTLGRKTADGRMVPYYTRREIEGQGVMRGREIAWLKDPFEAYVVTVQGSAKLRLADGSLFELGYAANTGHEYTSIGQAMIKDGVLDRDELSLQSLIAYFKAHPQDVQKYCWQNNRYVFFRESSGGPYGSINVPVIPYRSIATDKSIFPRACIAYVETQMPVARDGQVKQAGFGSFIMDQDTGGAIRAAGRGDIFVGTGPNAEAIAGRVGAEGKLYYIFVPEGR